MTDKNLAYSIKVWEPPDGTWDNTSPFPGYTPLPQPWGHSPCSWGQFSYLRFVGCQKGSATISLLSEFTQSPCSHSLSCHIFPAASQILTQHDCSELKWFFVCVCCFLSASFQFLCHPPCPGFKEKSIPPCAPGTKTCGGCSNVDKEHNSRQTSGVKKAHSKTQKE